MLALWYQACDSVIAVSKKSAQQLQMIADRNDVTLNLSIIPTGVNPPSPVTDDEVDTFRREFNIQPEDEVIIYFGRLGQEKNLAMLIPTIERVICKNAPTPS